MSSIYNAMVAAYQFVLLTIPLMGLASLLPFELYLGRRLSAAWSPLNRGKWMCGSFAVGWLLVLGLAIHNEVHFLATYSMPLYMFGPLFGADSYGAWPLALRIYCFALVPPLLGVVAAKLWGTWLLGLTSEEERTPGAVGLRAWLNWKNVLLAIAVAVCFSWPVGDFTMFLGVLLLMLSIFAAYPLLNTLAARETMATTAMPPSAPPDDDLAAERARVLDWLQVGRITASEAAELIAALAVSRPVPTTPARPPLTLARKLAFAGASLVLLGFFLPWYRIDISVEAATAMRQVSAVMSQAGGGTRGFAPSAGEITHFTPDGRVVNFDPTNSAASTPIQPSSSNLVAVTGGDVSHGIGWAILALAAAAALLPAVLPNVDPMVSRNLARAALAVGAVLLLYLLVDGFRSASVGLAVVIVGYALQGVAVLQEAGIRLPLPSPRSATPASV